MAVKQDLTKLSINQLSLLTGKAYNSVRKLLSGLDPISKDGRTLLYLTKDALAYIYDATKESDRERLDRVRADQVEFDLAIKRGDYAPIDHLRFAISDFASQSRAIFEGIPKKVKHSLPTLRAKEIKIIEKEIIKARNSACELQVDMGSGDSSRFH